MKDLLTAGGQEDTTDMEGAVMWLRPGQRLDERAATSWGRWKPVTKSKKQNKIVVPGVNMWTCMNVKQGGAEKKITCMLSKTEVFACRVWGSVYANMPEGLSRTALPHLVTRPLHF